jgi:hypothetical protein
MLGVKDGEGRGGVQGGGNDQVHSLKQPCYKPKRYGFIVYNQHAGPGNGAGERSAHRMPICTAGSIKAGLSDNPNPDPPEV